MKTAAVFVFGALVGAIAVLQLRENHSTCCKRVGAGVREELVDRAGPLGGVAGAIYDALNLGAIAGAVLDAAGVPHDA